jgi:serine/threonine-protein kinase
MGVVYLAAAQGPAGFSKLVALKELKPDLVQDSDFLTMFLDEARLAARLNHPNIVQTNDITEFHGRHFIAMEYLEGRSLYHVLKRFAPHGGFPLRMALAVLRDVLSALDYAHELTDLDGTSLGFVHRDISPHNIFVTFDGHTKVIDFGIAKARDSSIETKTGVLKGRAAYMAPEQLTNHVDRRSDIFAVGAILFEVISGRRLWQGLGDIEILAHLTRGDIPSLQSARPDTPATLLQICERALSSRPEDRYSTAAAMRDAIDSYLWSTGETPKLREISSTLVQHFEADRQETREVIQAALARLQSGETCPLEILAVPELREPSMSSRRGGVGSRVTPYRHTASQVAAASVHTGASRVASLHTGTSRVSSKQFVMPPAFSVPHELVSMGSLTPVAMRPGELLLHFFYDHRKMLTTAALTVVFLATVVGVSLLRPAPVHEPQPLPVVEAPRALPAPPAVSNMGVTPLPGATPQLERLAATAPEMIVFSVSVAPSTAQLFIDGKLMPSNPFLGHFPKDSGTHRIRAIAPGFLPKERLVSFEDNVMVDLNLIARPIVREPVRSAPVRRPEPPAVHPVIAASPPPPVVAPRPPAEPETRRESEGPRRRAIDSNNPYGDYK